MRKNSKKQKAGRKPDLDSVPAKKRVAGPSVPLSSGRKWLFRFVAAIVLPLLLLGGSELGVRMAGYGYNTGFFKKIRVDGKEYYVNNSDFSLRFFPASLARWPDPFIFPVEKPPDTMRIFIFGESAAMGDPQPAYAASRYLEVLLRNRFPGKKFEVINLGITAIDSHVILPIARDCERAGGDCWIIYMGNNEMVGPYGAVTVFGAQAVPRAAVAFNLEVQKSRLGQLLVAGLRKLGGKSKNASWGGMEMFLGNSIAPDDPRKTTVYRNFTANLQDIIGAGLKSGAKVILNTVSVNLKDCPPFASVSDPHLRAAKQQQFDSLFAGAKDLQAHDNDAGAAGLLEQAVKLNPQHAEAHFRLGQCELALTNPAARQEFQMACDLDALPFRTDTRLNDAIRQVAGERTGEGFVFCDAEQALAQTCPAGIAGDEILFEHVHLNFNGNFRLGKLWAEPIGQMLESAGNTPAGSNWISEVECDQALGLSIWNRQFVLQSVIRLMGAPPLSMQFNNDERLAKVQAEESKLRQLEAQPGAVQRAQEAFDVALKNAPADGHLYEGLANFLEAIQDPEGAMAAYRRLWELIPDNFYACLQLGRMLGQQGHPEKGQPFLEEATHLRPYMPDGWFELGNVLAAQQKYAQALESMEHASHFYPNDASYVCYAAQMLANLNRHPEAIEQYRKAIRMSPDLWQAHLGLAGELVAAGQPEEAMREYSEVIQINPRQVVSRLNLGVLLIRFNRLDDAISTFQNALQIDPENQAARQYLNSALAYKAQIH
ncbi:MAG TPA: tetratricopeptide repeat protein [Candidatus Acidoferrum sp.]|nr:tetratricopeptide repeat protein [Candidatus Acidoferrum sp.]